jgi:hypothetical protein
MANMTAVMALKKLDFSWALSLRWRSMLAVQASKMMA